MRDVGVNALSFYCGAFEVKQLVKLSGSVYKLGIHFTIHLNMK